MAKRVRTPEQIEADRQRMAKVRAARESKDTMLQNADEGAPIQPEPSKSKVELNLTDKTLDTEAQLHQYILWEFDEGRIPDVIKITSHQASNISSFTRQKPLRFYQSTFGNHYFKILSAKEIGHVEETL